MKTVGQLSSEDMVIIFIGLFLISLILAWQSMTDYKAPKFIKKFFSVKKIQGSLVFFKDKIKHYR